MHVQANFVCVICVSLEPVKEWTPRKESLRFLFMAQQPLVGHGLLIIEASRSHSDTTHSSGRVTSPTQRSLPDNTQQSQRTETQAFGGIRTRNTCQRAAADPRRRPRGHRDRQPLWIPLKKKIQDVGEFTVDRLVKQQLFHTIVVPPSSRPIIQKDLWTPWPWIRGRKASSKSW